MNGDPFDLDNFEPSPDAGGGAMDNAPPVGGLAQRAVAARGTANADEILKGLNEPQREAVLAPDGALLLLAGAGTGKTRALTARIAYKIASGQAYPSQILAVTFTNKAAREMRERIEQMLGEGGESVAWLGTFHSLSVRILRKHAELVGLKPDFTILDMDDQLRLIKQILRAENIDDKKFPPRLIASAIDKWKNRALAPQEVPNSEARNHARGNAFRVYKIYQERLKVLNATDFGDLLMETVRLLNTNKDVLEHYQNKFRHILVDEYQDTNVVQYMWLRLLARSHGNICCVGDDDQSIYGWRGAEIDNILRFEKDFAGAQTIRLEQNYRSSPHILAAASGLIAANEGRLGKTLWTQRTDGEKVFLRGCYDGEEEARLIGDDIENYQRAKQPLNEMAVLVRASFQMRAFEERFITLGLPYRVIGGPRFYERAEIRDANAYFRLVQQPFDDLAFERICNRPRRGLGAVALQTLHQAARAQGTSLYVAAQTLIGTDELKSAAKNALSGFINSIERWRGFLADGMPHTDLAEQVLSESGYTAMWQADKSPDAPGKLENLKELVRSMGQFENLAGFLEHIALVLDAQNDDADDKVSIMTLHAAKGLEFDCVFLPGWEEELLPHSRAINEDGGRGLEEERRLAYVGITRARRKLIISFAGRRNMHGRWVDAMPSRFIEELPPENIEVGDDVMYPNSGRESRRESRNMGHNIRAVPQESEYTRAAQYTQTIESKAVSVQASAASDFTRGERVFHQKFGYGKIEAIEGNKLSIAFEKAGDKKVLDNYVERA